MDSILSSIRTAMVPIRREGYPFIIIGVFLTLFLAWAWGPLFWPGLAVTVWCAVFFRDPPRYPPMGAGLVVSPADGRIAAVGPAVPPSELELGIAQRTRVSVFMNVFNCHVNRAPIGGKVTRIAYRPGKFINAELDKASEDNERNALLIEGPEGVIGVVQIAGLVARRILCWVKVDEEIGVGERIGMIRFGSRLDVYLPPGAKVEVREGQTAVAGETVIARVKAEAGPAR